jgi:hypothetical protein
MIPVNESERCTWDAGRRVDAVIEYRARALTVNGELPSLGETIDLFKQSDLAWEIQAALNDYHADACPTYLHRAAGYEP